MGYLLVNVQLPDSASTERTDEVMRQIEKIAARARRASSTPPRIAGQSFVLNATGSNFGSMFVILEDLRQAPRLRICRATPSPSKLREQFEHEIPEAQVAGLPRRRRCAASAGPAASRS